MVAIRARSGTFLPTWSSKPVAFGHRQEWSFSKGIFCQIRCSSSSLFALWITMPVSAGRHEEPEAARVEVPGEASGRL